MAETPSVVSDLVQGKHTGIITPQSCEGGHHCLHQVQFFTQGWKGDGAGHDARAELSPDDNTIESHLILADGHVVTRRRYLSELMDTSDAHEVSR